MTVTPVRVRVRKLLSLAVPLASAAMAFASATNADAKLYVFGDSLSDNGNIDKVTFGVEPGKDYFKGRFSNGPVWAELLGYRLGKAPGLLTYDPILTSRVDGYDFAHGGAAAVERFYLPDFLEAPGQTSYYTRQARKGRMSANAGDIATLWIGGNDYLLYGEGSAPTVVNGVMKSLGSLDATGVGRIVLLNLPALGETPGEIGGPDRAKLNALAQQHNTLSSAAVAAYRRTARAQITEVNVATVFDAVRHGLGGFTVTKPGDLGSRTGTCKGDGLLLAACPANYFFYDGVHPTATGHQFIASVVRDRLAAPVAAAARVAIGQTSALSTISVQLNQAQLRLAATPGSDGFTGYAFGEGGAAADNHWSQGYGAEWRSAGSIFGVQRLDASDDTALDADKTMSAAGDATGYAVYAAWSDGAGLTAAATMTHLDANERFRRNTEIDGISAATGDGTTAASALQLSVARTFDLGGLDLRPEASMTYTRLAFGAFTETGTFGLSDNSYAAETIDGVLGLVGATLAYVDEDWGFRMRAYAAANVDGRASVWTAAPASMLTPGAPALSGEPPAFGGGVWAELWLAGGGGWSLAAEGGAFTDSDRTGEAARVTVRRTF